MIVAGANPITVSFRGAATWTREPRMTVTRLTLLIMAAAAAVIIFRTLRRLR
jgi:hypothetical protein